MIPAPPASIGPAFSVMDWDSQSKIRWEKHLNGGKKTFRHVSRPCFCWCISWNSMSIFYLYKSIFKWYVCVWVVLEKNQTKASKDEKTWVIQVAKRGEANQPGSHPASAYKKSPPSKRILPLLWGCIPKWSLRNDDADDEPPQKKQDVLVIKNEKWWVLSLEWTFTGEHC